MQKVRVGSFRWAIGGLCVVVGAMMLVVPHQFASPVYAALQGNLPLWGLAFLAMGLGLIANSVLRPPRRLEIAIHLFVAAGWLTLAYGFVLAQGWTGTSNWIALGLASALAPFLTEPSEGDRESGRELLPLALGSGATLVGVSILAAPGQFTAPVYDVIRPYLTTFGIAFSVGGLALVFVHLRPEFPRPVRLAAHLLAGAVLLTFFTISSVPLRAWIGIVFYGSMGLLLWILPFIGNARRRFDPSTLQARLALGLAAVIVVSDVLVIAFLEDLIIARMALGSGGTVNEVRELSFAILVVSALVSGGAGIIAARWLVSPLRDLTRASERLAEEDLSVPLPSSDIREIADLASAFGLMRERLTEREKSLRESEEKFRFAATSIPDVLFFQDLELRYVWIFNPADPVEQSQAEGKTDAELYPAEEANRLTEIKRKVLESGVGTRVEVQLSPGGITRWYEAVYEPSRDASGGIQGIVSYNRDITERKRNEAERERLLEAEQEARALAEVAVKVRDQFISVAAHELKTPVTSLRGFAQIIQRDLAERRGVDPTRLARAMARIEQQTKRLTKLTEQLLDLSRLQAGKLVLCLETTDLSGLVAGVVSDLRNANPGRPIELRDGTAGPASVDPLRIEQVLTNLIDNAIKFSPSGTPVEIEMDCCEQGWVEISVRDRGIGVPPGEEERIFERFYQAHPDRHAGGMGIGLYVSREIVEDHGGSLRLERPEDEGSRFVLRLPAISTDEAQTGGL